MMSKLEKYPKYKDSGVEWLGEIPEGWEIKKLKFLIKEHSGNGFPIAEQGNKQGIIPFYKVSDINGDTDYLYSANNYVTVDLVKKMKWNLVPINSIIAAKIGEALRKNHRKITTKESVIDNNCMAIQPLLIDVKYNFYLHRIIDFDWFSNPGAVPSISVFKYKNFYVMVPPSEEQIKIANYLDQKTAQIDKAISLKEQMIDRLKERRQILINDAVTKGIGNGELRVENEKFKDSRVEWIGKIPEHWEVKKLFGLCNFIRGNSSFGKDELLNTGKYIALQYGKTYKVDEIDEKYKFYVNDEFYKESQIVKFGDTVLISTSETIEDLGHSAYYNRHDLGLLGGEQILLNPKKNVIDSEYLYFSSKVFSKKLRKYATGIKVFRFNINDLKTIYIAVPPLNEQHQIVQYIKTQTVKIDTAIDLQQKQIEKLKEYKATLIDSVVTGKVRVS